MNEKKILNESMKNNEIEENFNNSESPEIIKTNNLRYLMKSKINYSNQKELNRKSADQACNKEYIVKKKENNLKEEIHKTNEVFEKEIIDHNQNLQYLNIQRSDSKANNFGIKNERISILKKFGKELDLDDLKKNLKDFNLENYSATNKSEMKINIQSNVDEIKKFENNDISDNLKKPLLIDNITESYIGNISLFSYKTNDIKDKNDQNISNSNLTCFRNNSKIEKEISNDKKVNFKELRDKYENKDTSKFLNNNIQNDRIGFCYNIFKNDPNKSEESIKNFSSIKIEIKKRNLRNIKSNIGFFENEKFNKSSLNIDTNINDLATNINPIDNKIYEDNQILSRIETKDIILRKNIETINTKLITLNSQNHIKNISFDLENGVDSSTFEFHDLERVKEEKSTKSEEYKVKQVDFLIKDSTHQPHSNIIPKRLSTNFHRKSKTTFQMNKNSTYYPFNNFRNFTDQISTTDSIFCLDKRLNDNKSKKNSTRKLSLTNTKSLGLNEFDNNLINQIESDKKLNTDQILDNFRFFFEVYKNVNKKLICHRLCNEFILNFFKLSNIESLLNLFDDKKERIIANDFLISLELFLIIAYDFSHEGLLYENHISYLIDGVKILLKVFLTFLNLTVLKKGFLNEANKIELFETSIKSIIDKNSEYNCYKQPEILFNHLRTSIFELNESIKKIVNKHPNEFINNLLIQYFSNQITIDTYALNEFYILNICFEFKHENEHYMDLLVNNRENTTLEYLKKKVTSFRIRLSSVPLSKNYLKIKSKFNYEAINFQKKAKDKKFALVLDLDETLIHFEFSNKNVIDNNDYYLTDGVLHLRPGLYDFLESIEKYYELIIFTLGTQAVNYFLFF